MFRFIQNRIRLLFITGIVICSILLISCGEDIPSKSLNEKPLSSSEILSYFIKKTTGNTSVNGSYFFVCGPCCKGCVQKTLQSIDSICSRNPISKKIDWVFITSHEFVLSYSFENIDFILDKEWEKVNYEFTDVTYIKFINDSIVYSENLRDIKGSSKN